MEYTLKPRPCHLAFRLDQQFYPKGHVSSHELSYIVCFVEGGMEFYESIPGYGRERIALGKRTFTLANDEIKMINLSLKKHDQLDFTQSSRRYGEWDLELEFILDNMRFHFVSEAIEVSEVIICAFEERSIPVHDPLKLKKRLGAAERCREVRKQMIDRYYRPEPPIALFKRKSF